MSAPPQAVSRWRRRPERPLVIGHRGASAGAVENTGAAFELARQQGADGVELDVQLCATGEPVVFHDATLERLAGRPAPVAASSLAALRQVRLAGGERIPTLAEALEAAAGMLVNVELKAEAGRGAPVADAALRCIERCGAGDRVLVSSFEPVALARVRWRAPQLPTGYLFHRRQALPLRRGWLARLLRPAAVHPDQALVDAAAVASWRRAGYLINPWTVDEPEALRRLDALGVDAVITNDPAAALAALA